jgi:hypothetical protein
MKSRLLAIGIPATAFVLTIAISLWQQRAPSDATAQVSGRDPAQAASLSATSDPSPAGAPPAVAPAAAPASTSPSSSGDTTDPRNMEVPVRFAFRNLPGASHLNVIMLNMTTDDLNARVTSVSAKTHLRSVVDVALQGHERKNLTAAGLEAEIGDQLTIQSPPFRDLSLVAAQ